jgi:hypothetical protein
MSNIIRILINNKLGGMWKELAVAYIDLGNIAAFVIARNDLCIKLERKIKTADIRFASFSQYSAR